MNDLEKILELAHKNNGFVTTKEVVQNNLNKMALKRLCDSNKLERISVGYYCLPNALVDDFYKVISKSKQATYSHATALYLHNLSDRTPLRFDITVPRGYGGSLQNDNNVSLHYVNKKIINLGVEIVKSPLDMDIRCYDIERTICDIIKDKSNMDIEIYTKALKWYAERKDKDILKLMTYAKKLNIKEKVIEIMRVIL